MTAGNETKTESTVNYTGEKKKEVGTITNDWNVIYIEREREKESANFFSFFLF